MQHRSSMARRVLATGLLAAALAQPVDGTTTQTTTGAQSDQNTQGNSVSTIATHTDRPTQNGTVSPFSPGSTMTAPAFAPLFVTAQDAHAYWEMLIRSRGWPAPDAREVARSFIKERLGVDGDMYVVAHFATTQKLMEGSADNVMVLTDALMNAFPDHSRHSFFGAFSDAVAGLTGGGQSPTALGFLRDVITCSNGGQCFSRVGRFLWSRTGPGYIYNTFIGAGNVIDTVGEDARALDLSFGIFPRSSTFLPENRSSLKLSQIIDTFKEEGLFSELPYIKRLKEEFDEYWEHGKDEWPLLARYHFVHEARRALARRTLTRQQYELVMKGGAPQVPLHGPIALWQLRNTPADASVAVRRFDINGYAASDILRFVASDGSEVMYIPGASSPFVTFSNEGELREWVVRKAGNRASLDETLSHFSIYNGQDGAFRTGVSQGLAHLASGRWIADGRAVDVQNASITGDVFEDMRVQVEGRLRDDARMRTSTAWDAWRTTLNRTVAVLGPVGYVPALALPVQAGTALMALGTGIDEGINGRTTATRNNALEGAVMTAVTNLSTSAALHGFASTGRPAAPSTTSIELEALPPLPSVTTGGAVSEPGAQPAVGADAVEPRIAYSMGVLSSERPLDMTALQSEPGTLGYLVQRVSNDAEDWTRRIIDLKKVGIEIQRRRRDDSRAQPLATNRAGYRQSFGRSLVFRVDSRSPAELLRNGGFGPSSDFHDLEPMLRQPTTIGSGSLRANNRVLEDWQLGFSCMACRPSFHQYAIRTERRPVAAASDNHDPRTYDLPLDEVHFPADVSPENIFIIDSTDREVARKLADIYRSSYVSTPYGVPLSAFQEYVSGQLDINASNKYTGRRSAGGREPASVVDRRRLGFQ
ncbi:DUF6543 domain-containing protein [Luteibacter sp. SG786]|uniref:dermonecrotic toxin domain-containing protein n=1 Tax=Luteibacter sp. SG786 TaxID=2587130 RepID=UPI001420754A|nr:DUF6543 domain-containing protein [Luteibacter sp. SG786]NII53358.1 hypothetical protein [Luteibacter sp. SG786]